MTEIDYAALRELYERATGGTWRWSESGNIVTDTPNEDCDPEIAAVYTERDDDLAPVNALLIFAMHESFPTLLTAAQERDALEVEVERLRTSRDAYAHDAQALMLINKNVMASLAKAEAKHAALVARVEGAEEGEVDMCRDPHGNIYYAVQTEAHMYGTRVRILADTERQGES